MANIETNEAVWESWDWSQRGDEWSGWWGGTEAMWYGALLPRIHSFVPTGTILEIAPGHGRWTQYLKDVCDELVLVDLAPRCIEYCRQRFADSDHITYHVNDGRSLAMVEDHSVDFAFSFDSLVHVEADAIEGYLGELARTLRPDGIGFLHHSNIREYRLLTRLARRMPSRSLGPLVARGLLIDVPAWRAESMSADLFAEQSVRAGLACITQERISWEHGPYLTDAISVVTPEDSPRARSRRSMRNPFFALEARRMARLYAGSPPLSPTDGAASSPAGDGSG